MHAILHLKTLFEHWESSEDYAYRQKCQFFENSIYVLGTSKYMAIKYDKSYFLISFLYL